MTDGLNEWRQAAYTATHERDEARADLEKWDDLRAETHERMRTDLTELIQSKWDAELCDPDAAMAADTVLDYLENDFAGQLARMQQRTEKAEQQVQRVREFAASDALQPWVRERLAAALDPPPPTCPRCHGHGKIPDWSQGLDPVYGEPQAKACPDCQETPA